MPPSYTTTEVRWSVYVAQALWAVSATLLVLLVVWSTGSRWVA